VGETDLSTLLRTMRPVMGKDVFVFCTLLPTTAANLAIQPLCQFIEDEGVTWIVREDDAEGCGLDYAFPSRRITLGVESSLHAVGFLAAITRALADKGISVNAVSAYHHDHLFVPVERAEEAFEVLSDIVFQSDSKPPAGRRGWS